MKLAKKKVFNVVNMIKRNFLPSNRNYFEQLYATNVRPLLENADSVVHSGL